MAEIWYRIVLSTSAGTAIGFGIYAELWNNILGVIVQAIVITTALFGALVNRATIKNHIIAFHNEIKLIFKK